MKKVKQNKVFYAAIVAVILVGTALSIGFSDSIGATIRDLKNSVVILLPPAPRDSTTGVVRPLQGTPLDVSSGIGLPSNTPTANPGASSSQPVPNFSGLITPWVSAGPNSTLQLPNDTILHGLADVRSGLINNSPSWSVDPAKPNLIADGIYITPVNPLTGGTVTMYMSVGNYGNKPTNSGFYVQPIINGGNKGVRYTSTLGVLTARTVTYTWIAPPGTHTYEFCVDTTNYIAETSETNNCATQTSVPAASTLLTDRALSQMILNTKLWETPLTIYDDLKIVGNVANGSVQDSESASYGDMGIGGSVYYIGTNSTGLRIKSGLDVDSTFLVRGNSQFQGNSQLWGPLQVLDKIDSTDLNVSGQTNLNGLAVAGNVTLSGDVNITGAGKKLNATSIGRFYTSTTTGTVALGYQSVSIGCPTGDNLVSCSGTYAGTYMSAGTSLNFLGTEISTTTPPTCYAKGRTLSIDAKDLPRIQAQAICFSPNG